MKNNNYYIMLASLSILSLATACKDDDNGMVLDGSVNTNTERLFMPMFRQETTTGKEVDKDPYACNIASEVAKQNSNYHLSNYVNDIQLFWYGVKGASGYRIKGKLQGTEWDKDEVLDTIVAPDVLGLLVPDLAYSTGYHFAIQAISPKGEQYNSKWFGYGDSSHQKDQTRTKDNEGAINTGERYDVPGLVWTEDVQENSVRVCFNLSGTDNAPSKFASLVSAVDGGKGALATDADGNWLMDEIKIQPSSDNSDLPTLSHKLTAEDLKTGYCVFPDCLTPEEIAKAEASGTRSVSELLYSNAAYIVNGFNNNAPRYYDRNYNSTMIRMKGTPGDPIFIQHIVAADDTMRFEPCTYGVPTDAQYCRIDTVLKRYMGDNTISEGQIYELEGGKEYYLADGVSLTKGLTLRTRPEDVAQGKRAIVYIGIGYSDEKKNSAKAPTIMLSRNAASSSENGVSLSILPISFENINFVCPCAIDYNEKTYGNSSFVISGNYFMNMYSQGLSFTLSELKVSGCSFRGFVRGFIRFQGSNRQLIENFIIEDCVWYDCGAYDTNGRGYSWFAGPGKNAGSNFYKNLVVKRNTMIDSPRHAFVSENGNLAWPSSTHWNVDIENNTFINFSQRSNNGAHGLFLETRYAPSGSKFTVKNNLFVMTKYPGDADAVLYSKGMKIDNHDVSFDFADNYATTVPSFTGFTSSDGQGEGTALVDGYFTNNAFSNSTNGAGYNKGEINVGGYGETRMKLGDNLNGNEPDAVGYQLTPEQLFADPNPKGAYKSVLCHHHNVAGFYYNNTEKVVNHPIYTKGIGDTRWKTPNYFNGWFVEKKYDY